MKSRKVSAETTTAMGAGAQSSAATRHAMIAEAAYFLAEKRGFAGGLEEEDWLAAEKLVDDAGSTKRAAGGKS